MQIMDKIVLYVTQKLRPFLLRIFPQRILRLFKGKMIAKSLKRLNTFVILPFEKNKFKIGINLIGNIKAQTGLGQSFRLVANEISKSGFEFSIYHYEELGITVNENNEWNYKISYELPYNINLIHINPHELGLAFTQLPKSVWDYRYNIGFWLWELEELPEEWVPCFNCLDEIWTPSEFISECIRKKTNLPVKTIPYCIETKSIKHPERDRYGLPSNQFLYLTMYDHNSIVERKNPMAVIEAFKLAFTPDNNNVGLVVKINNSTQEDITYIQKALEGYSNYYIITESMSREDVNGLIQVVDVLISLHRSEGFGLVLAEAMLLGTPTIATNWSSNTEFMNEDVSCLVKFDLVTIKKDIGPFKKGNRWANADLNDAKKYMIKLYENEHFYKNIADTAKLFIENKLSIDKAVNKINSRIQDILGEDT